MPIVLDLGKLLLQFHLSDCCAGVALASILHLTTKVKAQYMQVLNRYELDPLIFQEIYASGSSFMELGIVCVALSDASFRLWDAFLCLAVS